MQMIAATVSRAPSSMPGKNPARTAEAGNFSQWTAPTAGDSRLEADAGPGVFDAEADAEADAEELTVDEAGFAVEAAGFEAAGLLEEGLAED